MINNLTDSKEFIKNAKDPNEWYRLAFGLEYSASILNEKWDKLCNKYAIAIEKYGEDSDKVLEIFMNLIDVEKSYYFLMALAIENFIKGKLIGNNPDKIHIVAKIDPLTEKILEPIKINYAWDHNLSDLTNKLANISKFKITTKQRKVLDYLGEMIVWGGRYPAPVKVNVKSKDPLMDLTGKNRIEITKIFNKLTKLKISTTSKSLKLKHP